MQRQSHHHAGEYGSEIEYLRIKYALRYSLCNLKNYLHTNSTRSFSFVLRPQMNARTIKPTKLAGLIDKRMFKQ